VNGELQADAAGKTGALRAGQRKGVLLAESSGRTFARRPDFQDRMTNVERVRATFQFKPLDRLVRTKFYWWKETLARWRREGLEGAPDEAFGFDPYPGASLVELGYGDSPFMPLYEPEVLEERGEYLIQRDSSGRVMQVPSDGSTGMPAYLGAPVKSRSDWENDVRPRMDPASPERYRIIRDQGEEVAGRVARGEVLHEAYTTGIYMYLRNLFGPLEVLYVFHDDPKLIHDIVRNWLEVNCTVLCAAQDRLPLFRIAVGEDICYKCEPLISPAMFREFIKPYYCELMQTLRPRQQEPLHMHYDTDGNPALLIDDLIEMGVDCLCPLEVAAGCDPLDYARRHPRLALVGGIDKRVMARGGDAIDRYLERLIPPLFERGGYIPHCDHGVPHDVSLENYIRYRERVMALGTPA